MQLMRPCIEVSVIHIKASAEEEIHDTIEGEVQRALSPYLKPMLVQFYSPLLLCAIQNGLCVGRHRGITHLLRV